MKALRTFKLKLTTTDPKLQTVAENFRTAANCQTSYFLVNPARVPTLYIVSFTPRYDPNSIFQVKQLAHFSGQWLEPTRQ